MPPQLVRKNAAAPSIGATPLADAMRNIAVASASFSANAPVVATTSLVPSSVDAAASPADVPFPTSTADEYDPSKPNEYAAFCQKRLIALNNVQRERLERLAAADAAAAAAVVAAATAAAASLAPADARRHSAMAISGEEAFARRHGGSAGSGIALQQQQQQHIQEHIQEHIQHQIQQQMQKVQQFQLEQQHQHHDQQQQSYQRQHKPYTNDAREAARDAVRAAFPRAAPSGVEHEGEGRGLAAAARMMTRMGWEAGKGLGRTEQGRLVPLIAVRGEGGGSSGTIVDDSERVAKRRRLLAADELESGAFALSSVVRLTNMVDATELDAHFAGEVEAGCVQYGAVRGVRVSVGRDADGMRAVRVYVQFESNAAAERAMAALQGRFFGGRQVQARLYDETAFAAGVLD